MQAEIRNVGPWEMKCIEMTLVSSWKRAAFDLGDGCNVFKPTQNAPENGESKRRKPRVFNSLFPRKGNSNLELSYLESAVPAAMR